MVDCCVKMPYNLKTISSREVCSSPSIYRIVVRAIPWFVLECHRVDLYSLRGICLDESSEMAGKGGEFLGSILPPHSSPFVFIQPGGLQAEANRINSGFSCSASLSTGRTYCLSLSMEKCSSSGSVWPAGISS